MAAGCTVATLDVDAMRSLFSLVGSSRGCSASHLISKSKHHGITKASGYNLWRRHPIVAPFCARWPPQVAHESERGGTIPANRDSNVALCCVRFFLFNVRELAAVQTFPPDYEWPDAVKQAQRQIGNAVPPLVAQLLMGGE